VYRKPSHSIPERGEAGVEVGMVWLEVVQAAAEHGLAALSGSSPDVGVGWLHTRLGLSWLGRRFGLAANSDTAVELATAEGRVVRAGRDEEHDRF
jgi:FAD/FMN-containing dehydrogenase